jgi:hypothetical protein
MIVGKNENGSEKHAHDDGAHIDEPRESPREEEGSPRSPDQDRQSENPGASRYAMSRDGGSDEFSFNTSSARMSIEGSAARQSMGALDR